MNELIKQYFQGYSKQGIINSFPKFIKNNPEVEKYLNDILAENPNWESIKNIIYGICFDEQLKHCKNCDKELKYSQGRKHDYCSVKCRANSKEFQEKYKQTCIERYGCEHPFQNKEVHEKIKQTNLEKYGCEYVSQNKDIQKKVKQTNLEKYGCENPMQNKEVREKYKQTNLERYGYESPFQNKEFQKKVKQTNLERYGAEHPAQSKKIKDKIKQTNLEKYGCEYVSQNKEVREKYKQTNLEKYGCENPMQNKEVREKYKQTNLERYNCENPAQNKEIQGKIKQTNLERYGAECIFQSEKVKQKLHDNSYDNFILSFIQYGIVPLFSKEEYTGWDKTYRWKCLICQNEFEQKIYKTSHVEECLYLPHCWNCYPRMSGESRVELELLDFVKQYYPNAHKDKKLIKPYELDIVIDELKLAIEFNGDYWHSTECWLEHHDNLDGYYNYHLNKVLETNKKGYRLIHIWENNYEEIKDKLKDILEGKEDLNFVEDKIVLDRSWYNNVEIPGYKLVEELPPEIVKRNEFDVENCGYLIYERIN